MKFNILLILVAIATTHCSSTANHNVLVVTGGHGFDEIAFFEVFDSIKDVTYQHVAQPNANELIASEKIDQYDVIVFYDMYDSITEPQRQAYIQLLEQGKGMVFMHHALVSYQNWDEFKQIIGGKYYRDSTMVDGHLYKSTYEHDVMINTYVEDEEHPIMHGISDFQIFDEVYGNCEILVSVHPLLSTDHSESMKYIAWVNPYKNSEVVYVQSGHGPEGFQNENFRRILEQAIIWSANRH